MERDNHDNDPKDFLMADSVNQIDLQKYLTAHLPEYLELLQAWVAVNSYTANRDGVDELGQITAVSFAKLGFDAEPVRSKNAAFGDHLVLTRPGKSGRTIGLVSHLDTVFPRDEEMRNHFT